MLLIQALRVAEAGGSQVGSQPRQLSRITIQSKLRAEVITQCKNPGLKLKYQKMKKEERKRKTKKEKK